MSDRELRLECFRLCGGELRSASTSAEPKFKADVLEAAQRLYDWVSASRPVRIVVSKSAFRQLINGIGEDKLAWLDKNDRILEWDGMAVFEERT